MKVKRANVVVSGPSLGLIVNAVCPQTMPVLPMTRHCGFIGEKVTLSAWAKFASASCRRVAFPSTANGENGGNATICSCQEARVCAGITAGYRRDNLLEGRLQFIDVSHSFRSPQRVA